MGRTAFRIALAMALVGTGWSIGKAQSNVADFEMKIDAPVGRTNIICTRGCDFKIDVGSTAGLPTPNTNFTFACSNSSTGRCSATINGSGHVMR